MPGFAAQQTPEETHLDGRLRLDVRMTPEDCADVLHRATREGLTAAHREVPSVWLYDHRGSVLFDRITALPEYYLTRTERALLEDVAGRIAQRTGAEVLVELGAGTSDKTRLLLDALQAAGTLRRIVTLDVSAEMLLQSAHQLGERYPNPDLVAVVGDFEAPPARRAAWRATPGDVPGQHGGQPGHRTPGGLLRRGGHQHGQPATPSCWGWTSPMSPPRCTPPTTTRRASPSASSATHWTC
ncbi:MAG: L-histidine N(alpha)-methyltransferase [Thermoleophilia bacterium]